MPLTFDEYLKSGELKTPAMEALRLGSDPLRVDMKGPYSSKNLNVPLGTSPGMLQREDSAGVFPNHVMFGGTPVSDENELPNFIQSSARGLEEMVAGASLQVKGVFTRFPAIIAQEFSDLIGDNADQYSGVIGDAIAGMDDIADDLSQSLMQDYYRMAAEYNWAFNEDGERSFMFNLGSGGASLVEALGITLITKSPAMTAAFFGALQQTETYKKAIDAGKTPQQAFMIANSAGVTMGLLEMAGIKVLMKTMGSTGKRIIQKATEGAMTEGLQEMSQEASVIGIEGVTGVEDFNEGQLGQIGQSGAIGAILGGGAGSIGGAISDASGRSAVRSGSVDADMVKRLTDAFDMNIRSNFNVEKQTFIDSRLNNPKSEAGKRLKTLQDKVDQIIRTQLNGQSFENVFRTEKQQEEYIENIVDQMSVATDADFKVIQSSKLKEIQSDTKKLAGIQKELEKSGSSVVAKYAEKFDQKDHRQKYLGSEGGKSISEALIGMRKALRQLRKDQETELGPRVLDIQAEIASLEDTIQDFEVMDGESLESFDDKPIFRDGLEGLPEYKRIARQSKEIDAQLKKKEAEYKEWAEKTNRPEIFDFIKNERISVPGQALRKITRDASVKSFMKGLVSGQKKNQTYFIDVIGSLERFIKAMPVFKGKVLGKEGKQEILNELNKRKDKLKTRKMSEEDIDVQVDAIADAIEDMVAVAKAMTSEQAYKSHKKSLRKMFAGERKTLDPDLNTALQAMQSMLGSGVNFQGAWEAFDQEYGNMYRGIVDAFAEVLRAEDAGTISMDELSEAYATTLDEVEYVVNYGYVPNDAHIRRAAEIQAAKKAIENTDETKSDKDLERARRGKAYLVIDGFFNMNFETLNTLWVKLGMQNIKTLDMTDADAGFRNDKIRWTKRVKDIAKKLEYGKKTLEEWSHADSQETYLLERDDGKIVPYKLTKSMVIQRVMNLKNKQERAQAMDPKGLGYTQKFIDQLEGSLSMGENKFIDDIMGVYKEIYAEISPVYRDLFLIDMPKIENYAPSPKKSRDGKDVSIHEIKFLGPDGLALPSLTQNRVNNKRDFADMGVIEVLTHYVESAMYMKNYQKKVSDVSAIISDKGVKRGIIEKMGTRGYARLTSHIDYIKDMPERNSMARNELWDYMSKVFIVNKLMFKPNQMFKQYSSAFGLIEDVPTAYSAKHMSKMFNPISYRRWRKIFEQNETFKNRSEHIDADYNPMLDKSTIGIFAEQGKIVKWGMKPTVIGDRWAIVSGGGIYFDYLTKVQGVSEKEAVDIVMRKAEMSQQSSLPSNMTLLQKDPGPFARTIRMFSSSTVALTNMQMQAWAKYRAGDISRGQLFKNLALYQVVVPLFYSLMAGQIAIDDDDEFVGGVLHAAMKGNIGTLPIVGEGMDALAVKAVNTMTDAELTSYGIRGVQNPLGEFYKVTMKGMQVALGEEEYTEEEIFKVIFQLVDSTARLGSENAFNGLVGASEVVGEGSSEGLLRMFGYSKLTAEKMTGNK